MEPEFVLENTLGYLVNRCAILLKNELAYRFKQAGHTVTPEEWVILNRLWEEDGLSQNEIAERTIKDKTTVTRFLVQMEEKGLIVRKSSKEDGRYKNVHLTSYARKLKPILIPIAQAMLVQLSSGIAEKDLQIALNTLRHVEDNLIRIEKRRGSDVQKPLG
jgi:MarR family transcriptional regulator, organic hydroperoxide resistance regulator